MPLGDSVTAGAIDTQSGVNYPSYRYLLWNLLNENGYRVDFVGTRQEPDFQFEFDKDNEGHPGWRADHIASGNPDYEPQNGDLSTWLETLKTRGEVPDLVLIHLGTNDILQQGYPDTPKAVAAATTEDLRAIVGTLREYNPDVTIYIAEIIPMKISFLTQYVDAFNAEIPGLVTSLDTHQSRVILVDQNTGFDPRTDFRDHLHPNHNGETKMAERWYEVLAPGLTPPSALSADFSADSQNGNAPLRIRFTGIPGGDPPFEYAWDFDGDGVTDATQKDAEHTYSSPGRYTVSFKVTNEFGTAKEVRQEYIVVSNGQSEPYVERTAPCLVEAEEYDYGGEGIAYHDTTRGNQGGAFRDDDVDIKTWADLRVVGVSSTAQGEWLEYTMEVSDADDYLFSFRTTSGLEGQTLDLAVDGEHITGVKVPKNGWSGFKTVKAPSSVPLPEGRLVIRITMGGSLSLDSFEIARAGTAAPAAEFSVNVTSGEAPLAVQFTDTSHHATRWQWKFGDGKSSKVQNPAHIYTEPGTYRVTLTATGPGGSASAEKEITVLAPGGDRTPFKDHALPGRIEAEDYDRGGEGVAYHDTEAGNQGNSDYRSDDVDLELWDDIVTIAYAYPGEWLEYTIEVEEAGRYTVGFVLATPEDDKECVLSVDDDEVGRVTAPNTGGWGVFETAETQVDLEAGTHLLRLTFPQGWVNTDALVFTREGAGPIVADFSANVTSGEAPLAVQFTNQCTGTPPLTYAWTFGDGGKSDREDPTHVFVREGTYPVRLTVSGPDGTASIEKEITVLAPGGDRTPFKDHALPGRIEAEDYDRGGEGVAYHDTEAGNQGNSDYRSDDVDLELWDDVVTIAYAYPGEWFEYTVEVEEAGRYTVGFVLATPEDDKECIISVDDDEVGRVTAPNTGGWGVFETAETQVDLEAGTHLLRLTFPKGWVNTDALVFTDGLAPGDAGLQADDTSDTALSAESSVSVTSDKAEGEAMTAPILEEETERTLPPEDQNVTTPHESPGVER